MTDSTHSRDRRSVLRPVLRAALTTVLVTAAATWIASPAFADGDPASDVLAQQSLFLPQDAGIPAHEQNQLAVLLRAAARSGYQLRVAIIASSADLGSVTELWRQPQSYAKFLGQELALVYHGTVLVVMPRGLGLYHPHNPDAAGRSPVASMPTPPRSAGLGGLALRTIQRLAVASGHPVALPAPDSRTPPSSTDTAAWIVFAVGAVLIALAWTASFRARPPHLRRRNTAST